MRDVVVNPSWTFLEAAQAAWDRYRGGGVMGTTSRMNLLRAWGNVVGRDRALSDLDSFVKEVGGVRQAAGKLSMAESTFRELRRYLAGVAERASGFDGCSVNGAIADALRQGEGSHVEFKGAMPRQVRDLANEVAAFASSGGGIVLLGVDDAGTVVGFSDPKERVEGVVQLVDPTPRAAVTVHECAGKTLCVIMVEPGDSPVYYVEHRPYVRDGSLSRPAKPEEVIQFIRNRDVIEEREALSRQQTQWRQMDDELAAYLARGQRLLETAEGANADLFFDVARRWWEETQRFLHSSFGASAASTFHSTGYSQVSSGRGDIHDWCSQINAKLQFLIQVADRHRQSRPSGTLNNHR